MKLGSSEDKRQQTADSSYKFSYKNSEPPDCHEGCPTATNEPPRELRALADDDLEVPRADLRRLALGTGHHLADLDAVRDHDRRGSSGHDDRIPLPHLHLNGEVTHPLLGAQVEASPDHGNLAQHPAHDFEPS